MNIKDSYIHNGTAVLKDIKIENSVLKKILAGKDANDAYLDWVDVATFGSHAFDSTSYLPTAGGTMTGKINVSYNTNNILDSDKGLNFGQIAHIGVSDNFGIYTTGGIYLRPNQTWGSANTNGLVITSSTITYNGNSLLHAGNYTSYVYSKSTSDGRYVYKAGDTMTGALTVPSLTVTGASSFSQAINASILGNAATASRLQNVRTINGTSFDGSTNITTTNWGTARNISIADSDSTNTGTAVSVNGSAAVTLKLPSTIKATLSGNATSATKATNDSDGNAINTTYLKKSGGTMTGDINFSQASAAYDSIGIIWNNTVFIGCDTADGLGVYAQTIYLRPGSHKGTSSGKGLVINTTTIEYNGNTIWHAGNDGSGSGLDADLLDGHDSSYFATASSLGNYVTLAGTQTISGNKTFSSSVSIDDLTAGNLVVNGSASFAQTINGNIATANKVNHTLTIQLNGGTTEGTNKFTFDGDANKSFNITPSSIGAQVSGNYKTKQTAVDTIGASSNTLTFINSISQDTNGVITATTGVVRDASTSVAGVVNTTTQSFAGTKTFTGQTIINTNNFGNQLVLNRGNDGGTWGPSIIFQNNGTFLKCIGVDVNGVAYVGDNGSTNYKIYHAGNLTTTAAADGGTTEALVTTGDKYKWNLVYDWLTTTTSDTDTTINKWKELETFLTSITESDTLSGLLANRVAKSGDTMTGALTTPGLTVTGASSFSQAINGSILGNAATASRLQNARTISFTGAFTGSYSFDGSANISINTSHSHSYVNTIGKDGKKITWSINGTAQTALDFSTTFAPYNANGYLPLNGGTMSGGINLPEGAYISNGNTTVNGHWLLAWSSNTTILGSQHGDTNVRSSGDNLYHVDTNNHSYKILDENNYTTYINTTNFPGLNSVNTDSNVLQTISTSGNTDKRPLLAAGTSQASDTPSFSTVTSSTLALAKIFVQPSTGNLYLYNSESGDSPFLYFQRGDLNTDNTFDWRLYVSSGNFYFQNDSGGWNNAISFNYDGSVKFGSNTAIHSGNYTNYVNTTNFPGLNSVNSHTYTSTWTAQTANANLPIAISPNATPATSGNGFKANFTYNPSTNTLSVPNITSSGSTALDDATIGNLVVTGGASFAQTINGNVKTADKVNHTLTFTGGSTGTFNGSADLSIAIPTKSSWNYDDVYLKLSGGTLSNSTFGAQLTIERTGGANMAAIGFKNTSGMLGYLATNTVNGAFVRYNAAASSYYTILDESNHYSVGVTTKTAANYSLSSGSWVDSGITFPTEAGSYVLTLISGNLTATGVFSVGTSDAIKDEIALHLHGPSTYRLYARTDGNKLYLASSDSTAASRNITIKYKRLI